MTTTIDLERFRDEGVKVFAGRVRGLNVRNQACLNQIDAQGIEVTVHVPEDIYSINSSFFLGMFGDSIRELGEEGFRQVYKFKGKNIARVVEAGIREALKTERPL